MVKVEVFFFFFFIRGEVAVNLVMIQEGPGCVYKLCGVVYAGPTFQLLSEVGEDSDSLDKRDL